MPVRSAEQVLTSTASLMAGGNIPTLGVVGIGRQPKAPDRQFIVQGRRTICYALFSGVARPIWERGARLDTQWRPFSLPRLRRLDAQFREIRAYSIPES